MQPSVKEFLENSGVTFEREPATPEDDSWKPPSLQGPAEAELPPGALAALGIRDEESLIETAPPITSMDLRKADPLDEDDGMPVETKTVSATKLDIFYREILHWLKYKTLPVVLLDWRKRQTSVGFPSANDFPPGLFPRIAQEAGDLLKDPFFIRSWLGFYLTFGRTWGASALGVILVDKAMQTAMAMEAQKYLEQEIEIEPLQKTV